MIGRSGNPTLNDKTFEKTSNYSSANRMTIDGTVNKSFITLAILLGGAFATWSMYFKGQNVLPLVVAGALGGFILALVISFKPTTAPFLVPIYAALEGGFLGALSAGYEAKYHGITLQAALITMCVFFALLVAYKTRLIRATENFKLGIFAATGGIALVYLVSMVLGMFGVTVPYLHDSTPLGIGISLVIVVIAALNLVLDFDFIEQGAAQGAPKYMEWYGAFGLMVTLVWLYIEILRLLAKFRSRD
ncbi:putative YccA/Bax inhibitor family protein [Paenibacillus taihuensis]|uniref:Putative YccA/Bax inhibitor family protein n=1 Tax=Paenibacillus taihuensis TaxID=1156355 RepID=A0A3D9S079_9BACL|nr:Bax inhibitor-1/YccA family protein [Paenibacillus taihuensis]REE85128.1 putative YccA/Bax inhibitor family protein [Paenibacillus taihuensis]